MTTTDRTTALVTDTFEVRAPRGIYFDLAMAFAAASEAHPELKSLGLINVRYEMPDGSSGRWSDPYADTVWTFARPKPEPTPAEVAKQIRMNLDPVDIIESIGEAWREARLQSTPGSALAVGLTKGLLALNDILYMLTDESSMRQIQSNIEHSA